MKFQDDIDLVISRNLTNLTEQARAARREYIGHLLRSAWSALVRDLRSISSALRKSREFDGRSIHQNTR